MVAHRHRSPYAVPHVTATSRLNYRAAAARTTTLLVRIDSPEGHGRSMSDTEWIAGSRPVAHHGTSRAGTFRRSWVPTGGTEERRFLVGSAVRRSGVPEFRGVEL